MLITSFLTSLKVPQSYMLEIVWSAPSNEVKTDLAFESFINILGNMYLPDSVMHDSGNVLILIPIPGWLWKPDSDSDSRLTLKAWFWFQFQHANQRGNVWYWFRFQVRNLWIRFWFQEFSKCLIPFLIPVKIGIIPESIPNHWPDLIRLNQL